jgi:hypothetical protein
MGTTSNGLPYPESTDYVTDGAQAIEALADGVNDKTGLWLIGTFSNSNTTSLTMDSVFTSDFTNYRLVLTATGGSGTTVDAFVTFRVSTTPTNTNYLFNTVFSSSSGGPSRAYLTGQTSGQIGNFGDIRSVLVADITNPQVAATTSWVTHWQGWGSTAMFAGTTWGLQNSSNQHTGMQITCASSFTATARVYGYNI